MSQVHGVVRLHATTLIGEECYAVLSTDSSPASRGPCIQLLISKLLGSLVVLGGSVFKLPQIYKILSARSARGISLTTYVLECFVYGTNLAYSWRKELPLSTYGEQMSLTVQNMFITLLIIRYGRGVSVRRMSGSSERLRATPLLLAAVLMLLSTVALFSPSIVSPQVLGWLQASTVPADLISKVPQMRRLYQDKATGQLSALLVFLMLVGTLARCFTTATETGDHQMLLGYVLAALFNGIIAAQYVYYWHGDQRQGYRTLSSTSATDEEGAMLLRPPETLPRQVRRKEMGRVRSMDERRQNVSCAAPRRSFQRFRPSLSDLGRDATRGSLDERQLTLAIPFHPEMAAFEMGLQRGSFDRMGVKRD